MSVTTNFTADSQQRLNLREQVERLLPSWESWYPSLFHAAEDLGLIRARVCSPSSLMLSNRHAAIQSEALQAFKDQWCVEDEQDVPSPVSNAMRRLSSGAGRGPDPRRGNGSQRNPIGPMAHRRSDR
jgi:hypothetical protein